MNADIRFLLVAGVGIALLAWGVAYYGPIGHLTQTGVEGYTGLVRGLEPPSMGGAGGTIPTAPPSGYG